MKEEKKRKILIIHAILNNEKMFKPLLHERNKTKPNVSRHHRGKRVLRYKKKRKKVRIAEGRKNCENVIHERGLHASNILYMQSPQNKKIA